MPVAAFAQSFRGCAPPVAASGLTTVTGTVTRTSDGSVVPGGRVQLIQSGVSVYSGVPNGSGVYSIPNVVAGTYTLRNQPPLNYCIADAGDFTITPSGGTITQNLSLQFVFASADFSLGYSTANILAGTPWIRQRTDVTASMNAVAQGTPGFANQFQGAIVANATGGPSGGCALEMQWPSQPLNVNDYTISWEPRIQLNGITGLTEMWTRLVSWESASFEHGSAAAVQARAYKFMLTNFENDSISSFSNRAGVYLVDASPTPLGTGMNCDLVDPTGQVPAGTFVTVLGSTWGGSWHTWVFGQTGIGSSSSTWVIYKDGVLLATHTTPFMNGKTLTGSNWQFQLELGANINNGPDDAQTRRYAEVSCSPTRPSLI